MVYDPKAGIWLSRDPSGEAGGLNLTEAFNDDPINYSDPDGLAPEPVWDMNIPADPKSVNDLSEVTKFKNEVYNRSAFYWDNKPLPAPPMPAQNPLGGAFGGGWVVFKPQDYSAENKRWYKVFQAWDAREKELSAPIAELKKWLDDHPKAKYGDYRTDNSGMIAPGATPLGVRRTTFAISRPYGVAAWDVASAGIIGKGGPGSKSLDDVDPSSGYKPMERARPGTSRERINPDVAKNGATDARASAAEAGAEVVASALNEALNGMKKATVVVWTLDGDPGIAGFYVDGQPAEVGDAILQSWVKPNGQLWDRGKTYEK